MTLQDAIKQMQKIKPVIKAAPRLIGAQVVTFSRKRFDEQAWADNGSQPWPKRKSEGWGKKVRKGRGLLMKTGRGKNSIHVIEANSQVVKVGTPVDYMKVHNDGFRGKIEQHVRAFTRRTPRKGRAKRGTTTVKAHDRTINQNIPRRRFLGHSAVMMQQVNRMLEAEFNKAMR